MNPAPYTWEKRIYGPESDWLTWAQRAITWCAIEVKMTVQRHSCMRDSYK